MEEPSPPGSGEIFYFFAQLTRFYRSQKEYGA
jgi:hypothetical protein